MKRPFEKVYTVSRYHDGPRSGVADFDGRPHFYEWLWDDDADDYGPACALSPISDKAFQLALEDWAMWMRWKAAFNEGKASQRPPLEERPVLPEDESRHKEIAPLLKQALSISPALQFRAIGNFRRTPESSLSNIEGPWQVCWEPC